MSAKHLLVCATHTYRSIVKSGYGCYPSDIKINQLVNFALLDIKQEEWYLEVLTRKKLQPACRGAFSKIKKTNLKILKNFDIIYIESLRELKMAEKTSG